MSNDLTILSLNCRGLRPIEKRKGLFNYCRQKAQVSFLQETHSIVDDEKMWRAIWGNGIIFSHGTNLARGTIVLYDKKVINEPIQIIQDKHGRYCGMVAEVNSILFVFMCVYAPNYASENARFWTRIGRILSDLRNKYGYFETVLGGDKNFVEDVALDRTGNQTERVFSAARETFCQIKEEFELIDTFRHMHPAKKEFTWRRTKPELIQARLDRIYVSATSEDLLLRARIVPGYKSDHSCVTAKLKITNSPEKGPSSWKLNDEVLSEDRYVESINEKIPQWAAEAAESELDARSTWDFLKYRVREFTIEYCKTRKTEKEKVMNDALNTVAELEMNLCEENVERYEEAMEVLREIQSEKEKGLIIRSRAKWYEEGEKSSKYFLNLEKRNKKKTQINSLKIKNRITHNQQIIRDEFRSFYQSLYTNRDTKDQIKKIRRFLDKACTPTISEKEQKSLERDLTKFELKKATESLNDSTPGNDGLGKKFYITFWNNLNQYLYNSLQETIKKGILSNSQRQANIILLEKKGRPRNEVKNLRPISLLNTDYKIFTKVIHNRIENVIQNLICPNQTAYLKERFIGANLRMVEDIMTVTEVAGSEGIICGTDFEKAYDSCSWMYVQEVLKKFNFPEKMIHWIKIVFNKPESAVLVNGITSGYFVLERGFRQGDCLSCDIFLLAIEPLLRLIQSDEQIKGIKVGNNEIKSIFFADDGNAFLRDKAAVQALFNLMFAFGEASGLHINAEKTEIFHIGTLKDAEHEYLIKYGPEEVAIKNTQSMKICGITFSHDRDLMFQKNFVTKLAELRAQLGIWKMRSLTTDGRVTLAKCFGMSQVLYPLQVLYVSDDYLDAVEKSIYKFIWNRKECETQVRDKIKRRTLQAERKDGGLKAPDIKSQAVAVRFAWIKRFFAGPWHPWKITFEWILKHHEIELYSPRPKFQEKLPPKSFYRQVLEAAKVINTELKQLIDNIPETTEDLRHIILEEPINGSQLLSLEDGHSHLTRNRRKTKQKSVVNVYTLIRKLRIHKFKDLLNPDGSLIKPRNPKDWLLWNTLKCRIPKQIIAHFEKMSLEPLKQETFLVYLGSKWKPLSKLESKDIVSYLRCRNGIKKDLSRFITKNIGVLVNDNVNSLFIRAHQTSLDVRTRQFNFKILHGILYLNKLLWTWNIVDSPRCSYCYIQLETVQHLFLQCVKVQSLWNYVERWWNDSVKPDIEMKFTDQIRLLGVPKTIPDSLTLNIILTECRMAIYNGRNTNITPRGEIVLHALRRRFLTEKRISHGGTGKTLSLSKWSPILAALDFSDRRS